MNKMYFINYQNLFFSTYNEKCLVIGTPDFKKMISLKDIMVDYTQKNDCLLNKFIETYNNGDKHVLTMSSHDNSYHVDDFTNMDVLHLDMDKENDLQLLYQINQLCNCDMFIMSDFNFDVRQNMLSLQGMYIKNSDYYITEDEVYDFVAYFDNLMTL
jgi:hypothetical protein